MKLVISAGEHDLDGPTVDALWGFGWDGVRMGFDSPFSMPEAVLRRLALREMGVLALVPQYPDPNIALGIVASLALELPGQGLPWCAIEAGNEPDNKSNPGWYMEPADLNAWWVLCYDAVRSRSDAPFVFGWGSSLSRPSLEYLRQAQPQTMPPDAILALHDYRTTKRPSEPLWGRSREEEFNALRAIAGPGRRLWCTEVGWHTAPYKKTLCLEKRWTETQVAQNLGEEARILDAEAVEVMVVYQMNDGPDRDSPEHNFGIRTTQFRWKLSAHLPMTASA